MAHGHGQCCCCCGEAAAALGGDREQGAAWGLYLRIDRQRLQCLNERREGSGALVFRAWEERGDRTQVGPGRGPPRRRCPGRAGRRERGSGWRRGEVRPRRAYQPLCSPSPPRGTCAAAAGAERLRSPRSSWRATMTRSCCSTSRESRPELRRSLPGCGRGWCLAGGCCHRAGVEGTGVK